MILILEYILDDAQAIAQDSEIRCGRHSSRNWKMRTKILSEPFEQGRPRTHWHMYRIHRVHHIEWRILTQRYTWESTIVSISRDQAGLIRWFCQKLYLLSLLRVRVANGVNEHPELVSKCIGMLPWLQLQIQDMICYDWEKILRIIEKHALKGGSYQSLYGLHD